MFHHFTFVDICRTAEASLLLSLFAFVPGYVAGWFTNILGFREARPLMRLALSTPLAVCIVPIAVFLVGRFPVALWVVFALTWIAFAVLVIRSIGRDRLWPVSREARIAAAVVLCWAVIAILSLVDLQLGQRLYFSVAAYDHCVRTAMTAAAARSIPPANPFFASTPPVMLRYHYFWMMVCSLVTRISGVAPRYSMYGGVVWGGIGLMSLIPVGLRYLTDVNERLGRKTLIGVGLLAVTGLDILVAVDFSNLKSPLFADLEWWNTQVSSWADATLWTPHHVLAMVACMMGLVVLMRQGEGSQRQRVVNVVLAGFAFASASGLSTLVTFTFAIFVGLWLAVCAIRGWWNEIPRWMGAGVVAAILALPYLHLLMGPGLNESRHSGFVYFAVREFPYGLRKVSELTGLMYHQALAQLLMMPVNYLMEFGFFLLVAIVRFKQVITGTIGLSRKETAAWTLVFTSFLIGSFVHSSSLTSNDLGWRCFLPTQFIFLLWAAIMIDEWRARPRRPVTLLECAAAIMLVLGFLGTAYQVVDLRVYPILHDLWVSNGPSWMDTDRQAGRRNFALRSVYDQLATTVPRDAVVQYNPEAAAYIPHLLYSGHDAAMGMPRCGAVFGGDIARCEQRAAAIEPFFEQAIPGDGSRLDDVCTRYGISVVVVEDSDPAWKVPGGWVWNRNTLVSNSYARAFGCGVPR